MSESESKKRKLTEQPKQRSFRNLFGLLAPSQPLPFEVFLKRVEERSSELNQLKGVKDDGVNSRMFACNWMTPNQKQVMIDIAKLVWQYIQISNLGTEQVDLYNIYMTEPNHPSGTYAMEINIRTKSGKTFPAFDILSVVFASGLMKKYGDIITNIIPQAKDPAVFNDVRKLSILLCLAPWDENRKEMIQKDEIATP